MFYGIHPIKGFKEFTFTATVLLFIFSGSVNAQPDFKHLKDIEPGVVGSNPANYSHLDSLVLFSAEQFMTGRELYAWNINQDSVYLVKDLYPGSNGGLLGTSQRIVFDGKLIFNAMNSLNNPELFVSDGTSEGTRLLKEIDNNSIRGSRPSGFTEFNGLVYFVASDRNNTGRELWTTDGTTLGTKLLLDMRPGLGDGVTGNLVFNSDTLICWYAYNGSSALIHAISADSMYTYYQFPDTLGMDLGARVLELFKGKPVFANSGHNLYTLDENDSIISLAGSELSNPWANPGPSIVTENFIFFYWDDGIHGQEPWISDGTVEGTRLIKDIRNGPEGSNHNTRPFYHNGIVYFAAYTPETGYELCFTDGTEEGTHLIDINTGGDHSYPRNFSFFDDKLYFTAEDANYGRQLWTSNGTIEGTNFVFDPETIPFTSMGMPFSIGDTLIFAGETPMLGAEPWIFIKDAGDADPCIEVQCPEGEVCYEGACYPIADPCIEVQCPEGEVCYEGACYPVADPCIEVQCPEGEVCYEGACYPVADPCIEVQCAEGEVCYEGACYSVADPCIEVQCAEGEVCYDGVCLTIVLAIDPSLICDDIECPEGSVCYEGSCYPVFAVVDSTDDCNGIQCPPGEVCYEGLCFQAVLVSDTAHDCEIACGDYEVCIDNACYSYALVMDSADLCANVSCASNEVCYEGACYPVVEAEVDTTDECDGIQCPPGEVCVQGACFTVYSTVNSVSSTEDLDDLVVYPNPSTGDIFLSTALNIERISIRLTDISGRTMLSRQLTISGDNTKIINSSDQLQPGYYLLRIDSDGGHTVAKKVIID